MSPGLLLAYYGDDFTGSTDVMEALSQAGLRTVLFLQPPSAEVRGRYPGLRAFGVAGGSRTMSTEEMEAELPPAFLALQASGAPLVHYKVCSTFDSAPKVGCIGRAIEIGRRVFGERPTPLVVGAPVLGRYVVFGNLFARSGLDTEPFRLDRHPAMSRHPVTPMREADIRRILAGQTELPVELVDVLKLEAGVPPSWGGCELAPAPIVLFDTLRPEHLPVIGRVMDEAARERQLFVVGSSGIEYALVEHWKQRGLAGRAGWTGEERGAAIVSPRSGGRRADLILAVSGSCSPVTDRQIARALRNGFAEVGLDTHPRAVKEEVVGRGVEAAAAEYGGGKSVILHTSRGLGDPRLVPEGLTGLDARETGLRLGGLLAEVLERLLESTGVRRAVVCGGDTSMHVARALGIEALEYLGPMAPGSPLCKVHAPGRAADGCEMVFKGGQVGRDRFFLDVLHGGPWNE